MVRVQLFLVGRGMAGSTGGSSKRTRSTMVTDSGERPRSVMLMVGRSHCPVMVLQVPNDRFRTSIQSLRRELATKPDYQLDNLGWYPVR